MKKRNGMISLLKFLFALVIMLYHITIRFVRVCDGNYVIRIGYLAVEFYFIVSGYYFGLEIIKAWNKRSNIYLDNLKLIWKKIKKFLPYSIFTFICCAMISYFCFDMRISRVFGYIYDMLFLGATGFGVDSGPLWYISTMLVTMFILYPFVRKYKNNYVYYAAPLIALFGTGYLFRTYHHLDVHTGFWNGVFTPGLLRSFAEINIGIIIAALKEATQKYLNKLDTKVKYLNILLTGVEVVLYLAIFAALLFYPQREALDFTILLLIIAAIFITLSERSYTIKLFSNNVIYYLEELSLPIFANHIIFVNFFNYYLKTHTMPYLVVILINIGLTLVVSMIELWIINYIKKRKLEKA